MSPTSWRRCSRCAWQPHGLPSHVVAVVHRCPSDYKDRTLLRESLNDAAMDPKPRLERTESAQAAFDASLGRFGL